MEEKLISAYRAFLDNGKTERECIRQIISKAEACGFRDISTAGRAKAGDRLYYLQDGKSIALFIVGSGKAEDGMNILGAHIDSPRLDIKMKPLYESDGGAVVGIYIDYALSFSLGLLEGAGEEEGLRQVEAQVGAFGKLL